MEYLRLIEAEDWSAITSVRQGECKSGQCLRLLSGYSDGVNWKEWPLETLCAELNEAWRDGARFALLGVPEDISPRANLGRGGAQCAWSAFLPAWANLQANRFLDYSKILLLGSVECTDLQERSAAADVKTLRSLCAELDQRVSAIVAAAASAQLIPVVIGGGHGGSWGIIKGVVDGFAGAARGLAVINCDPHGDYRPLEGRHSGNAFSYARQAGWLQRYHVLGLHESYNSENMLKQMAADGVTWTSFEDIFVRSQMSWEEALCACAEQINSASLPVGIECDMDSIAYMPSSAMLPYGISLREAARYVFYMGSHLPVAYLHCAEAAPGLGTDGERTAGRALAWLVACFCKAVMEAELHPMAAEEALK
ncbi:MAG: arginase family protein [bacterium]|nr:arginase family protein [bacterium]